MSQEQSKKLMVRLGERFGVDPDKLFDTLKLTAFRMKEGRVPTNEEMMALLIVADQHGLNPFCREIYAFPDKQGGIMPVVSVRGWERIINEHAAYDALTGLIPRIQTTGCKSQARRRPAFRGSPASCSARTEAIRPRSRNFWMKPIARRLPETARTARTRQKARGRRTPSGCCAIRR